MQQTFFEVFFDGDHILKPLLNLLQYCFCFMSWFFGHEACGILAPQPGAEPILLASEGEVLITRLPGKSLMAFLFLPLMSLGGVCLSAPEEIPVTQASVKTPFTCGIQNKTMTHTQSGIRIP